MGMFDYFAGPLKCSDCGVVTIDETTNMQIKIRKSPNLQIFRVGDQLEDLDPLEESGYYKLKDPIGSTINLLETWDCPNCHASFQWARIALTNWRVHEICESRLTPEALEEIHYISDEVDYFFEDFPFLKTMIKTK